MTTRIAPDDLSLPRFGLVAVTCLEGDGVDSHSPGAGDREQPEGAGADHGNPLSRRDIALVSYFNGVQPLTQAFDGFFVHSRGGGALPLVGPGKYADIAGGIGGTATILRTDRTRPWSTSRPRPT
jgi:hypothetical protein